MEPDLAFSSAQLQKVIGWHAFGIETNKTENLKCKYNFAAKTTSQETFVDPKPCFC